MKRTLLVFIVAALVVIATLVWGFIMPTYFGAKEDVHIGVILIAVIFALFFGYKRLTSERRGEPAEDELSKRVMQRTAAISYYISLYMWLLILIIKDKVILDAEAIIGTGILGMAVVFAGSWFYLNFRGVTNE